MAVGPVEIIIVLVLLVMFIVIPVWAIVDAMRASEMQWQAVGQSRYVWVVLIAAGTIIGLGFFGFVLGLAYLLSVRPKLARAASSSTAP